MFNRDWRELDALISVQFWRVAFYRVAEDEINYRRFFNINDLAGLRMELAPVFEHAHARVFQMLGAEEIEGLRIDHVDGLFDPKAYLEALRDRVGRPFYLVVEKILAPHEQLCADWPVEGTTGYDYLNLVARRAGGPVRRSRLHRDLWRICRRQRRIRRDRPALQAEDYGQRDGERTECARPRGGATGPPKSDDSRSHSGHPAAGDQADRRELSGLSHVCRFDRFAIRRRPT